MQCGRGKARDKVKVVLFYAMLYVVCCNEKSTVDSKACCSGVYVMCVSSSYHTVILYFSLGNLTVSVNFSWILLRKDV